MQQAQEQVLLLIDLASDCALLEQEDLFKWDVSQQLFLTSPASYHIKAKEHATLERGESL
jgi:hypothetical protein